MDGLSKYAILVTQIIDTSLKVKRRAVFKPFFILITMGFFFFKFNSVVGAMKESFNR